MTTDQLRTTAACAKMASLFSSDKKEQNNWKKRMLQAGVPQMSFPDDWDSLSEEVKQERLDKVLSVALGNEDSE